MSLCPRLARASRLGVSRATPLAFHSHRREITCTCVSSLARGRIDYGGLSVYSKASTQSRQREDSKGNNQEGQAQVDKKIDLLLNERLHPLGSYTTKDWSEGSKILKYLAHKKDAMPDDVTLGFSLLVRMVKEHSVTGVTAKRKWLYKSTFLNKLVKQWRNVAKKRGKEVIDPVKLGKMLEGLSKQVPEFKYDKATFSMIMDVILRQKSPQEAPIVAESLLNFLKEEAHKGRPELKPDHVIWTQVLKAWSNS